MTKNKRRRVAVKTTSIKISSFFFMALLMGVLGGCSKSKQDAPPAAQAAMGNPGLTVSAAAAFIPRFGGLVQEVGNYVVELLVKDDGRLEAQVRNKKDGQPVSPVSTSLSAEIDIQGEPVRVVMMPKNDRFIGTVAGVEGSVPVSLSFSPPNAQVEMQTTFPAVPVVAMEGTVSPQHSGQVSIVGDHRVEVATAATGQVMVSVTDLHGAPLPPSAIELRYIRIMTSSGPQIVALRPQGAVFVGVLDMPPPPTFSVHFDMKVRGHLYSGVHLRHMRPLPPGIIVSVPPPFAVAAPLSGGVHLRQSKHPGRGRHKGWRNHQVKASGSHPGRGWHKGWTKGQIKTHGSPHVQGKANVHARIKSHGHRYLKGTKGTKRRDHARSTKHSRSKGHGKRQGKSH